MKAQPYMDLTGVKLYGTELYDHQIDPEENVNRADMSEYKEIKADLSKQLRVGWRKAMPPEIKYV